MAGDPPVVEPFGDAAVLITLDLAASEATAARAQAVARRIRAAPVGRTLWGAVVPAATTALVHLDPTRAGRAGLDAALAELREIAAIREPGDGSWPAGAATHEIPVRYGAEDGPDLVTVAEASGLTPAQVIEAHAGRSYRALFVGFAPGFAYLGPLSPELVLPRRDSPRVRVPAGSVAIAGPYAAIYPIESPGGWHLLGRTDVPVWSPEEAEPARIAAGSLVRFVPVRA